MQRNSQISAFYRFASLVALGTCTLFIGAPARAQTTGGNVDVTTLSDVAGPFLGNILTGTPAVEPPPNIAVTISTLDKTTRDILISPETPNLGEVLKICVHLSTNLATLAPFSGCTNINWRAYNRAVSDTKQLNRELIRSVGVQKAALSANPSPQERAAIEQRLALLEKTTDALESTTEALVLLGEAMDKAR